MTQRPQQRTNSIEVSLINQNKITRQGLYQISNLHLFPSPLACTEGKFKKQILVINASDKHKICEWQQAASYLYTVYSVQSNFSVHMQHLHLEPLVQYHKQTHNHLPDRLVSFWNNGKPKIGKKKPFSLIFRSVDDCRGVAIFEPTSWRMHWTCRITLKNLSNTCVHVCSCSPQLSLTNQIFVIADILGGIIISSIIKTFNKLCFIVDQW